ncbi:MULTISPECIES: pyridoxamine 5'-phosphate oxidase family protein [unclassified Haladaptatus]|uniref:pyridoxamine 5'-phosphate oxidase family protein n=1 Tax=unclassified Haladaptatus TaxID=2622732 RepID=UPI0023E75EBB|nr:MULTISPECIES: pyridoxamine 5'-phosphate oxidase family protein [unclassified Haladaptatus]
MTIDHIEYTFTEGMSERDVDRMLKSTETGVLALSRGGEAYAIPVAFHYDGERIIIRLGRHQGSEKMAFIETTTQACLTCYDYDPPDDSWSIIARGSLRELTGAERATYDDATVNEAFIPIRIFGEATEELEPALFELEIRELTGRRTG